MYEQAQPVRALVVGVRNVQTRGPASQYRHVRESVVSGRVRRGDDNSAPDTCLESLETSSDTYEEPEVVRLQIAKLSPPVQETGAQQTTPQEEVDAANDTPDPEDTSANRTYQVGPRDRRNLRGFLRAHYRSMAAAFVVGIALVTLGLVLMVFVNKTSQLSTTVDILKRNLASERNRTAVLGQHLDQMNNTSAPCLEENSSRSNTSLPCPEQYTKWRGVCYKAFNKFKTFWDSDMTCHHDNGTLAMPRDADTNAFLISLKSFIGIHTPFWIGLHDQREEGRFEWLDGTALCRYNSWAPGQPNSYLGIEDCVAVAPTITDKFVPNMWYDAPCHRRMLFACQVILGQT